MKYPSFADLSPDEQARLTALKAAGGSMPIMDFGHVGGDLSYFVRFTWAPGTKFVGQGMSAPGSPSPIAVLTSHGKRQVP